MKTIIDNVNSKLIELSQGKSRKKYLISGGMNSGFTFTSNSIDNAIKRFWKYEFVSSGCIVYK